MKKVSIILFIFGFLLTIISMPIQAQNDPVAMLQNIANNMIAGLKANKATLKTKPTIVYNLAYHYVVPHANLAEMSKRVLPPIIWNNATTAQRAAFQKEFTITIIRTYASALTSYKDQTVKFYPVRGHDAGLQTVEVSSDIIGGDNPPIHIVYRLIRTGSDWKLFDMAVEGVSMLDSFRAQFADILSQGSLDQLLSRMRQHNQRRHL